MSTVGVRLVAPAGSRGKLPKMYAGAAAITMALGLPDILWAWSYYGSTISHMTTYLSLRSCSLSSKCAGHTHEIHIGKPSLAVAETPPDRRVRSRRFGAVGSV